jgi:general secretion pathway protein J
MKPTLHSGAQGFTLVELMVALFIFALISAAGVTLLSYSVSAQASAGTRLDEVAALRRVGAILTADLAQASPSRAVRAPPARSRWPLFAGAGAMTARPHDPRFRRSSIGWSTIGWSGGSGIWSTAANPARHQLC